MVVRFTNTSHADPEEIKLNIFFLTLLCGATKDFTKVFYVKTFIKLFEAPQNKNLS